MGVYVVLITIIICLILTLVNIYVWLDRKRSVKIYGDLRIDRSDFDGPYLFVELSTDVETLSKNNYVSFKVVNDNYISDSQK